jgi:hypothetical protein
VRKNGEFGGAGLGEVRDQSGGPRMDTMFMCQYEPVRRLLCGGRLTTRRVDIGAVQLDQRVAHFNRAVEAGLRDGESIAIGNDHGSDETLGPSREHVQVECQERLPAAHMLALGDQHAKSDATHGDGVDAHVQQNFRALGRANG